MSTTTAPRGFIVITSRDGGEAIINVAHIVGVFDDEESKGVCIAQSHGYPIRVRESFFGIIAQIKNARGE